MKKFFYLSISLFLLFLFSFISRSEICCMFSSSRYYGWPSVYISVNKTTDSLEEAKKVETESGYFLLKNGWQPRFSGHYLGSYGATSSALLNLILNFLFFLTVSILLVNSAIKFLSWTKKRKRAKILKI